MAPPAGLHHVVLLCIPLVTSFSTVTRPFRQASVYRSSSNRAREVAVISPKAASRVVVVGFPLVHRTGTSSSFSRNPTKSLSLLPMGRDVATSRDTSDDIDSNNAGVGRFSVFAGRRNRRDGRRRPNYGQFRPRSQFSLRSILSLFSLPSAQKVTYFILIANIVFFVFQQLSPRFTAIGIRANDLVAHGQTHRLWTSIFLHGGIMHLLINTLTLRNYGPTLEELFGRVRFFTLYFLSGFAGNLVGLWYGDYYGRSLGASGAIFGILGGLLAHIYRSENKITVAPVGISVNSLLFTIGLNVLYGLQPHSRIDNYAHMGGLIAGGIIGYVIGPQKNIGSSFSGRVSLEKDKPIVPPTVIYIACAYTAVLLASNTLPMVFEMFRTLSNLGHHRMSALHGSVAAERGGYLMPGYV